MHTHIPFRPFQSANSYDLDLTKKTVFFSFTVLSRSRLLPLIVHADQTAQRAGEADEAVIQADPAESGGGDGEIT